MKVLIVEDNPRKLQTIREIIGSSLDEASAEASIVIEDVDSINGAIMALSSNTFDLVIADLVLPQHKNSSETIDATPQWCEYISSAASVKTSTWIVMTQYSSIAADAREVFARHNVAVVHYEESGYWQRVLSSKVRELFVNPAKDFLIVCALTKERSGFEHCTDITLEGLSLVAGLDCRYASIGSLTGVILVLPETGLVAAAIATSKAAAIFRPTAIAMPGICGGITGESQLGDLLVPDVSWNYQAGKIVNGSLRPELMQVPLPPHTKATLQQLATKTISFSLREGLFQTDLRHRDIAMPPVVSGSSVVDDPAIGQLILSQSRKVGGLDMEIAAVFSAAHDFYNGGGIFFAAKTVVDLADGAKDDRYHEYGCALSARFVTRALQDLLRSQ